MKEWKSIVFILALAVCLCGRLSARTFDGENLENDSIEYSVSEVALQEVTVKADRFIRGKNGLTAIPDANQKRHASSGYDLLRNLMIPGVSVDAINGKVSALGGDVSLYIDGMPADPREVRQIRPADVERVVFMDAPDGRYAGDVTALNFILRKRDTGGYVGADAMQHVGYDAGDYSIAAKYFHGQTQYTLFAGTDYRALHGVTENREEVMSLPAAPIGREYLTNYSSSRSNSQYSQIRVRNKNDRRTLRATFNVVRDAIPLDHASGSLSYSGMPSAVETATDRYESSRSLKYSLGLSGTFKLPNDQTIDASASASLARTSYDYMYEENRHVVMSDMDEDFYNLAANLSYVRKFPRGNTITAKMTELFNVSSASYAGSYASGQHLWMSESLAFVEYMHPLGVKASLRVSPGISAQVYRLHGNGLLSHFAPRAQMVFTMQPGRAQFLQVRGAYGNSYPQLSMITGATTQVDIFRLRRGNPSLGQTHIWSVMAAYGSGVGNVSFQAVALLNGASSLPVADYFIEGDMLVQSYRGDGRWCHFNPYLSVTWIPSQRLNLQLTGGWLYNSYRADASGDAGVRRMTLTCACWTAEARVNWYAGAFVFSGFMKSPQKTAGYDLRTTRTIWDFGLTAGWSHRALRLEATIRNPFLGHPVYTHTLMSSVYTSRVTQFSPADRRSLAIKASYTIDFGKKTSHDKPEVDRSVSSALLKAL